MTLLSKLEALVDYQVKNLKLGPNNQTISNYTNKLVIYRQKKILKNIRLKF